MSFEYSTLFSDISIGNGDEWRITLPRLALVVTKRPHDYHCALAGNSAVWDCGKTVQEAVGAWALAHGSDYGIGVEVHEARLNNGNVRLSRS